MIIITGPGRSGTSFLARAALELGFAPGGSWYESINAGLEDPRVVELNERIIDYLGMTHLGAPGGARGRVRRIGKRLLPRPLHEWLAPRLRWLPWMASGQPSLLKWELLEQCAEKFKAEMAAIAADTDLVKDPRFCWTLGVWAAAGIEIEHVLLSLRTSDAAIVSRNAADHLRFRSAVGARNSLAYGLGLCLVALVDNRIPYNIVRFPDFLDDPDALFDAMHFPAAVTRSRFVDVIERIRRTDLVHDPR